MARALSRSYHKPGRLVPTSARRLKGRAILLRSGEAVDWHSTRNREELILVFRGSVSLEMRNRGRALTLSAGRAVFIPPRVWHRVVNRAARQAHYVYVTA